MKIIENVHYLVNHNLPVNRYVLIWFHLENIRNHALIFSTINRIIGRGYEDPYLIETTGC
jgi:hypothetical protein